MTKESRFVNVELGFELPTDVVANRANLPNALELVLILTVAVVPAAFIEALPIEITAGEYAGWKENTEPLRFRPVTDMVKLLPA